MKELLDFAREVFDVAGVVTEGRKTFLILGLVSRPDRDLDVFISNGWGWKFPGFYEHFTPKVKALVQKLKGKGFSSEQKRYYELNLKEMAIRAGLGCWGKNSLVIHPQFGPRLRFVALETDAPLEPTVSEVPADLCGNCDACLKACPVEGLLRPYKLTSRLECLAYIQLEAPTPKPASRCDKCLAPCPVGLG